MSKFRTVLLWVLAFLFMASAAVYQRLTGPTNPKRGTFVVAGKTHHYRLLRSQETSEGARISLPDPGQGTAGTVVYRRFPTADPWTTLPLESAMERGKALLNTRLPIQPAAGKLEYQVHLATPHGALRLPEQGPVVLRYKDPVPTPLLICHVACMFFGMLLGIRTGLSALFQPDRIRAHTLATLGLLTLGGMVLGPFVQKYAFGAYWTGWPIGGDLTDDKTAFLWLAWVGAAAVVLWLRQRPAFSRITVLIATAVMLAVYLIPHSARGSQLDYTKGQVKTGK